MALPLPYRPLELRANGVWDPELRAFYPFRQVVGILNTTLLSAKPGICYYLKRVTISAASHGDKAATSTYVVYSVGGSNVNVNCVTAHTTAASGSTSTNALSAEIGVLCDSNTSVVLNVGADIASCSVVYAEVPADGGET